MGLRISIPPEVREVLRILERAGFEAYAVGGCVRDSILGRKPQDWDICTSARPEQTQACFDHCVLTGVKYGTVTVIHRDTCYEITTFRMEGEYTDSRHPGEIRFLDSLYEDLARRDLSINAMAADLNGAVTDHFDGIHDLRHGFIRAVGDPQKRFTEDALRILRALRFAARFDFTVEPRTAQAIHQLKDRLLLVSSERIRKELSGLLVGKAAQRILEEFSDVIAVILPEMAPAMGFEQHNPHHRYDVYGHSVRCVSNVPETEVLRLAALFHDIGKPHCFHRDEEGIGHFYGHPAKSGEICRSLLRRLHYDNKTISHVTALVQEHDVYLQPTTEKGLRRLLSRLGEEILRDLISLRKADIVATGTATSEEATSALEQTERMLEALLEQEGRFTLKDLALKGSDLIAMGVSPGQQIGRILNRLFEVVIEGICQNQREDLVRYVQILLKEEDFH